MCVMQVFRSGALGIQGGDQGDQDTRRARHSGGRPGGPGQLDKGIVINERRKKELEREKKR